jgi:hypothetical protein
MVQGGLRNEHRRLAMFCDALGSVRQQCRGTVIQARTSLSASSWRPGNPLTKYGFTGE